MKLAPIALALSKVTRSAVAGIAICSMTLISCEDRSSKTQSQLQMSTENKTDKGKEPAMTHPKAIIVAWVGPSDRPTPPTVLWSDKEALQAASAWIAGKGGAPFGVTAVETKADSLTCMARAIGSASGTSFFLEIATWDSGASSPVRLGATESRAFLDASVVCVGNESPAAGYLKSLRTMIDPAARCPQTG